MQKIANPRKKFIQITDLFNNSAAEDLSKKLENMLFNLLSILFGGSLITAINFPLRFSKIQPTYVIQFHKLPIAMDLKINI